jgi:hypothetical protein
VTDLRDELEPTEPTLSLPATSPDLELSPAATRRNFLKLGALAAGAASLGPSAFGLERRFLEADETDPDAEPVNDPDAPTPENDQTADTQDMRYDLSQFEGDPNFSGPALKEGDAVDVTIQDFTNGLRMAFSCPRLDPVIRDELFLEIDQVETNVLGGKVDAAVDSLHRLRDRIICWSLEIDLAAGVVGFGESVSFSQTVLTMVDFLISLRTQLIGVIFHFPAPLITKIIQATVHYRACLTVVQVQNFWIYLRFWLFLLVIRFRFGWLGLRVSIDLILIYVSICLRVTITTTFQVCVWRTRRQLLLVRC